MQERVVREIRTLRAMWRALETGSRQVLNGHEGGNPGHKPRMSLRATAPVLDPTRRQLSTIDRIEATFGPAWGLPKWIQFFRPKTSGTRSLEGRDPTTQSRRYPLLQAASRHL